MWTYEDLTTPLIDNTLMTLCYRDSVAKIYRITPIDGYVLHDSRLDYPSFEDETIILKGYTTAQITIPATYDFEINQLNLYTKLANEVEEEGVVELESQATESDYQNALAEMGVDL